MVVALKTKGLDPTLLVTALTWRIGLRIITADGPVRADADLAEHAALIQRIRETADPSLYAPAAEALDAARALSPDDASVLVGIGGLQLGKHFKAPEP